MLNTIWSTVRLWLCLAIGVGIVQQINPHDAPSNLLAALILLIAFAIGGGLSLAQSLDDEGL